MRNKICACLLVAIMVFAYCYSVFSLQLQGAAGIVKASSLRVRSEPNGVVIDKLLRGSVVNILGVQETETNGQKVSWYRIEYLKEGANEAGYASADWIVSTGSGQISAPAVSTAPMPVANPPAAPATVAPIGSAPTSWFDAVHAGDPKSQDWTNLKNYWVKRYTDETLKYVLEANDLMPNLEQAEINAHLDTFFFDVCAESAWARDHANRYRAKGLDLSIPIVELNDFVNRSILADDLANTLQLYITAIRTAQANLNSKK